MLQFELKRSNQLVIWLSLFLAINAYAQNNIDKRNLYLEYKTSTQSYVIKDQKLIITEWIEIYDNPISSIPDSRQKRENIFILTDAEFNDLVKVIRKSGFFSLNRNEFGENPQNRNYESSLEVKLNRNYKRVIYRSSPAPEVEACPEAFNVIVKILEKLGSKK